MSKARQPGRQAMHEYVIGIAVLFALPVIYLALAPNPVVGEVTTIFTRTPTATPISQQFLPVVVNGDFPCYPPPFFIKSYQGRGHADDLDCGDHRVSGYVFDKDEGYWAGQALLVRVSGDGFDETVPVSAEQSLHNPGYQVDIPDATARYTVQLLEQDGAPASCGYYIFPNEDCFWNVIHLWFEEQTR